MKIAFFSLLLLAAKATQTTAAARGIVKVQNEDNKSVRALIGENTDEDGVGPSVIGGEILDRDVWELSRRYLVDIQWAFPDGLSHWCGATKISNRVVLTAAHCFTITDEDDPNFGDFDPNTEIQFNRYAQDDDDGVITIELCQTEGRFGCDGDLAYVVRHPDWNVATVKNDIALIFLPEDLPGDIEQRIANLPNVALNCIPNVPVDGEELEVFGWGYTCQPSDPGPPCPDGVFPNEIQTGKLEYLTNEKCKILRPGITDDMLCAKTDSTSGVAAGGGDSGGPLVDEFNVQVGVVSFGTRIGNTTFPTAPDGFARVSFFCDWIENQVCADVPNDQVFCRVTAQPTSRPTSKASKQTKPAKASKKTEQATAATQADPQGLTANAISGSTNSTNPTSLPTSQPTSNQTMKVKVFN